MSHLLSNIHYLQSTVYIVHRTPTILNAERIEKIYIHIALNYFSSHNTAEHTQNTSHHITQQDCDNTGRNTSTQDTQDTQDITENSSETIREIAPTRRRCGKENVDHKLKIPGCRII